METQDEDRDSQDTFDLDSLLGEGSIDKLLFDCGPDELLLDPACSLRAWQQDAIDLDQPSKRARDEDAEEELPQSKKRKKKKCARGPRSRQKGRMGVESFFSDADEVDILPSGLFTPEKPSDASCSLRAGQQRPAKDKSAKRARSEGQDEGAILPAKKKSAKGKRSPQQGKMGVESFLSDADEIDILPSGLLSHETPTYQSCNPNTGQPPPKNFGQPSKGAREDDKTQKTPPPRKKLIVKLRRSSQQGKTGFESLLSDVDEVDHFPPGFVPQVPIHVSCGPPAEQQSPPFTPSSTKRSRIWEEGEQKQALPIPKKPRSKRQRRFQQGKGLEPLPGGRTDELDILPPGFYPDGLPLDPIFDFEAWQQPAVVDLPSERPRDVDEAEEVQLAQTQQHAEQLKGWQQSVQIELTIATRMLNKASADTKKLAKLVEQIRPHKHSLKIRPLSKASIPGKVAPSEDKPGPPAAAGSQPAVAKIGPNDPMAATSSAQVHVFDSPGMSAKTCSGMLPRAPPAAAPQYIADPGKSPADQTTQTKPPAAISVEAAQELDLTCFEELLDMAPSPVGQPISEVAGLCPEHLPAPIQSSGTAAGPQTVAPDPQSGLAPLSNPQSPDATPVSPEEKSRLSPEASKPVRPSPSTADLPAPAEQPKYAASEPAKSRFPARLELDPRYAQDAWVAAAALAANNGDPAAALCDLLAQASQMQQQTK